jgi:hypothetical protein
MPNKPNTKNKDKPNIGSPSQSSQNIVQESSSRTTRITSQSIPKEAAHVLGVPPITHNRLVASRSASASHKAPVTKTIKAGTTRSGSNMPRDRGINAPTTANIPADRNNPAVVFDMTGLTFSTFPKPAEQRPLQLVPSVINLNNLETFGGLSGLGSRPQTTNHLELEPNRSEHQEDILAGLNEDREEREVCNTISPQHFTLPHLYL